MPKSSRPHRARERAPRFPDPHLSRARSAFPAKIPADAPPLFLLGAADDEYVADVLFDLTRKYHAAGASIETHIYAQGKHAFNMGQRSQYVSIRHWPQRLAEWLEDRGLTRGALNHELRPHSGSLLHPRRHPRDQRARRCGSRPRIIERNLLRPYRRAPAARVRHHHHQRFHPRRLRHLLFNSLTLYFFGPALERTHRHARVRRAVFHRPRAQQPRHGLQAAQQSRLRLAGRFGRDPRGAVRVHRLLPEAACSTCTSRFRFPAVVFAFGYLAYTLVGVEESRATHQPRCASRWRAHRADLRGPHRLRRPWSTRVPVSSRRIIGSAQNHE